MAHHLGMQNFFENNEKKKLALEALGDTSFHTPLDRYLQIVLGLDFELALEIPFKGSVGHETFYVFWRRGILMAFDTFWSRKHVNGGKFSYNWEPKPEVQEIWRYTSSGTVTRLSEDRIWVGDHDCREALKHHISQLEAHGRILETWVDQGYLTLLHHGDEIALKREGRTYNLETMQAITNARISLLPERIRKAISGKTSI
jgi:hypothetical protein